MDVVKERKSFHTVYVIPVQILPSILWMYAGFTIIHSYYLGLQGDVTNDFIPVYSSIRRFLNHKAVYVEDLNSVNPHYLYPPSGSLLLSPLGLHNYSNSRTFVITISVIAIIFAILILLIKIGISWKSPIVAVALIITFNTESVIHTLSFTNINGIVFLAQAIFLTLFLTDSRKNSIFAGIVLGLTFALKPILFPLAILALMYRRYACTLTSLAVPIVLNVISFPMTIDGMAYFHTIVPYVLTPRIFYNSAISGIFSYYGIHHWITTSMRVFLFAITLITLYLLWEQLGQEKTLFSYSFAGISAVATFLLSSLGQGYYSMYIIPLLLTIFIPKNIASNVTIWIGAYLCLSYGPWVSNKWPIIGDTIDFWRIPGGWTLILLETCAIVLTNFYLNQYKGIHIGYIADHSDGQKINNTDYSTHKSLRVNQNLGPNLNLSEKSLSKQNNKLLSERDS